MTWQHARAVGALSFRHHDPFDRLLIAQAKVEDLVQAAVDQVFYQYDVPLLWCANSAWFRRETRSPGVEKRDWSDLLRR